VSNCSRIADQCSRRSLDEIVHRPAIPPRTALVLSHALERAGRGFPPSTIRSMKERGIESRAADSVDRRLGFTAALGRRGCTPDRQRELHLIDGHLVHGLVEMHSGALSSPFGPSRTGAVHDPRDPSLLRPLLTSRSIGPAMRPTSSVQTSGEISPGKTRWLSLHERRIYVMSLDRKSFAVNCPLTLVHPASDPISVRRPAGLATPLLSASRSRFSPCGSLGSLRSASQKDFHLPSQRSCWAHNKSECEAFAIS